MIVRRKERLLSAAVFVPVALMVMVLAFVQYRSSNEESEANKSSSCGQSPDVDD
jgi:hypothetical protein